MSGRREAEVSRLGMQLNLGSRVDRRAEDYGSPFATTELRIKGGHHRAEDDRSPLMELRLKDEHHRAEDYGSPLQN